MKQKLKRTLGKVVRLWRRFYIRAAGNEPPICDSVKQWVESRPGAECRVIRKAQTITRKLPQTIEPDVPEMFRGRLRYEIPEKYLTMIEGVRLVGKSGLVILPDGSYAAEVTFGRAHLEGDPAYYGGPPKVVQKKGGCYFSLLLLWAGTGSYYHWMQDVLPRLYLTLEWLPDDVRMIVPTNLRPYQKETFALLGLPEARLCYFSGTEAWELEALYFAPPETRSGHASPDANRWLRGRLLMASGVVPASRDKRVYISRRLARYWRITNESEVEACLRRYGFETYMTETMTIREQASLFARAAVVVSNHGSGLTNILFAQPGATVLDIMEPSNPRYCYWTMSEAAGHHYWYFWGQTARNPDGGVPDILVPLDKLTQTLEMMLSR